MLCVERQDAHQAEVGRRVIAAVVGMYVTLVVECFELRRVLGRAQHLDDLVVGARRRRRRYLRPRMSVSLCLRLVCGQHPACQPVNKLLAIAYRFHRTLPVIVKYLPREYISTGPRLIPPPRTSPRMITWIPVPEGEIST